MSIKKYLEYEKFATMVGWNFEKIAPYIEEENLPWSYVDIINKYKKNDMKLLDIETGGGEILLQFDHPYSMTTVLEGFKPNYLHCKNVLEPLGITVVNGVGEEELPFENHSFDIITNRQGAYRFDEIFRVLKPGGYFITQQVGYRNNEILRKKFNIEDFGDAFDLKTETKDVNGFDLIESNEYFYQVLYKHIKAVIYMAKIIEWEFPGFSIEKDFNILKEVEDIIQKEGFFTSSEHRFYFVLQKKKDK